MCHYCCEACLEQARQSIMWSAPDLSEAEVEDYAIDARSNRDHPCSEHA